MSAPVEPTDEPTPAERLAFDVAEWDAAVEAAFAPLGPEVLACAHAIAERESNHNPYALNGRHQGVFQLQPGFDGTIQNLAAAYGFGFASRFDPFLNALAARDAFLMYGTFSVNWPTTPGGCP